MSLTNKQLAGNQRRTLRAMRERLLTMAAEWDGLDGYIETRLTELADQVGKAADDVTIDPAMTQD